MFHLNISKISKKSQKNRYTSGRHLEYISRSEQYSRSNDLVYTECSLNNHAVSLDEYKTWLRVYEDQSRVDARIIDKIKIGFPEGFSTEQQIELVHEFIKTIGNQKLSNHIFAIHHKNQNKHVHIAFVNLNIDTGQRIRSLHCTGNFQKIRSAWSRVVNDFARDSQIDVHIDHRSFKDRGIDLMPTIHVGIGKGADERKLFNQEIINYNQIKRELQQMKEEYEYARTRELLHRIFKQAFDTNQQRVERTFNNSTLGYGKKIGAVFNRSGTENTDENPEFDSPATETGTGYEKQTLSSGSLDKTVSHNGSIEPTSASTIAGIFKQSARSGEQSIENVFRATETTLLNLTPLLSLGKIHHKPDAVQPPKVVRESTADKVHNIHLLTKNMKIMSRMIPQQQKTPEEKLFHEFWQQYIQTVVPTLSSQTLNQLYEAYIRHFGDNQVTRDILQNQVGIQCFVDLFTDKSEKNWGLFKILEANIEVCVNNKHTVQSGTMAIYLRRFMHQKTLTLDTFFC
ncbi:MAG: MobA/MobL family protein [SAR324 cluster bacterium]|nr:MobA/MobL family protein [SAR324 cluster bacterium]